MGILQEAPYPKSLRIGGDRLDDQAGYNPVNFMGLSCGSKLGPIAISFEPTMSDSKVVHKGWVVLGISLAMVVTTYAQTQGMKDFGNRVEGTNVHLDASEDFTLIAVHRNFATFPRNANLNVRFFLPRLPGNPKKNVLVQAVELQDSFHYFMQSKNSTWSDGNWNTFADWPTKDVIDPDEQISEQKSFTDGRIGDRWRQGETAATEACGLPLAVSARFSD